MTAGKVRVFVVMLFAVAAVSWGEALLSRGMKQTSTVTGGLVRQVLGVAGNGYVLTGLLLMATFLVLYLAALRWADLSFVLPLTSASFVADTFIARHYLGETVSPTRWLGVAVITAGVILISLTDANSSSQR
jgi:uncharacterized membrane protein